MYYVTEHSWGPDTFHFKTLVNKVYKVAVAVAAGRGPLALVIWPFVFFGPLVLCFSVLWSPVPLLPWSFGLPVLWSIFPWSFGKLSAHPLSVPQFVLDKNFFRLLV